MKLYECMQDAIDKKINQCKGGYVSGNSETLEVTGYCVNGYLSKMNGFTYHGNWVAWIDFACFVDSDDRYCYYKKGVYPKVDVVEPIQTEQELQDIFEREYTKTRRIRLDCLGALNNLGWTFKQFHDYLKEFDI